MTFYNKAARLSKQINLQKVQDSNLEQEQLNLVKTREAITREWLQEYSKSVPETLAANPF